VLVSAAVFALGFAAMNPDAWVANRNIDRFEAGRPLDTSYLSELSADATPVIVDRLPLDMARCVVHGADGSAREGDDLLGWNLGRERAESSIERIGPPAAGASCSPLLDDDYRG
jgi:hypothetical protein